VSLSSHLRSLSVVLTLALALCAPAHATTPAATDALSARTFTVGDAGVTIDLRNHFGLPGVTGQLVQFDTVLGKFNIEMLADAAPISVTNFLGYVNRGNYTNSIIHRSEPGFVIQGGGFYANSNLTAVPSQSPIALEVNLPNQRGTLAMARTPALNSATSQWFINLGDNTTNLGQATTGGYAVFARVLGTGMNVVDSVAALGRVNLGGNFANLPMLGPDLLVANLVTVRTINAISTYPADGGTSALSFSVQNSDPSVATVSVTHSELSVAPAATGTTTVTVTVTDTNGNTATNSFDVTVGAPAPTAQSISFPALPDVAFTASPLTLSASASSGLPVSFELVSGPASLSGNTLTLTGTGSITVRATQAGDATYAAATAVDVSFNVTAATATISFGEVNFTYDGTPKPVTVSTTPAGLAVSVTYATAPDAPTAAGSYAVVATITAANYTGSATTTLVIAQATQTITFTGPADQPFGSTPLTLNATATSGLPVTFAITQGPATLAGNTLTLAGAGTITLTASQPGNTNYAAASDVVRSFVVTGNFASFQLTHFTVEELANPAISGPTADPDGDGLANLLEYALGLAPKTANASGLPEVAASAGEWTYTYTRPSDRADITYAVERSTDLTSWTTADVTHELVSTDAATGTQTWRARVPLTTGANGFFRLKVERGTPTLE
jgi:cyclophilin family peptidyl-prolyl cis-trans isomerase